MKGKKIIFCSKYACQITNSVGPSTSSRMVARILTMRCVFGYFFWQFISYSTHALVFRPKEAFGHTRTSRCVQTLFQTLEKARCEKWLHSMCTHVATADCRTFYQWNIATKLLQLRKKTKRFAPFKQTITLNISLRSLSIYATYTHDFRSYSLDVIIDI